MHSPISAPPAAAHARVPAIAVPCTHLQPAFPAGTLPAGTHPALSSRSTVHSSPSVHFMLTPLSTSHPPISCVLPTMHTSSPKLQRYGSLNDSLTLWGEASAAGFVKGGPTECCVPDPPVVDQWPRERMPAGSPAVAVLPDSQAMRVFNLGRAASLATCINKELTGHSIRAHTAPTPRARRIEAHTDNNL